MKSHHLAASPETCHWGVFDAALAPVLRIASGDRVTVDTVSGSPEVLPPDGFHVPPELFDIHARSVRNLPGHILTGPIAIEGALPGDVLEVRIVEVILRQDWAYNVIRPLSGTIPEDFDGYRHLNIPLDVERHVARMPWGVELPLAPFFGIMGVAPPAHWGRINTIVPRAHGGNLDNKELRPGATLWLPVHASEALFSCGDGHAAQGDGEVCTTALETAMQGTLEFVLHKKMRLMYPRAETPNHYITMGMHPDLDQCLNMALRDMIRLAGERGGLSAQDAYTLCSVAADFRVTQTVNGSKGVHAMLAKSLLRVP